MIGIKVDYIQTGKRSYSYDFFIQKENASLQENIVCSIMRKVVIRIIKQEKMGTNPNRLRLLLLKSTYYPYGLNPSMAVSAIIN